MDTEPTIQYGVNAPLPQGARPYGLVLAATAALGNQPGALETVNVQQTPPGYMSVDTIAVHCGNAAGANIQLYVVRDGVQRQLSAVASPGVLLGGSAQYPMRLSAAELLEPGDQVVASVGNLANAAQDVEIVLWGAVVEET